MMSAEVAEYIRVRKGGLDYTQARFAGWDAAHKVRSVFFRNVAIEGERLSAAHAELFRGNNFVEGLRVERGPGASTRRTKR